MSGFIPTIKTPYKYFGTPKDIRNNIVNHHLDKNPNLVIKFTQFNMDEFITVMDWFNKDLIAKYHIDTSESTYSILFITDAELRDW